MNHCLFPKQSTKSGDQPNNKPKKQVSFGSTKEIGYEPTYEGGFAYNAVMATRRIQARNQCRKKSGVILDPDNFSIDLVIENPSQAYNSFYGSSCTNVTYNPSGHNK